MPTYSHLHCHTQFSLLDGAARIPDMIAKAKRDNQPAVAITDHGNMFGVFKFVAEANKQGVIPIVGCEFYLVNDRHRHSFTRGQRDKRYHQLLLAKNQKGYQNLSKLCSLGYIEGLYSKYPRIDMQLIKKYREGLIATTCCVGAQVPQTIINKGEQEGEKVFKQWLDIFGDDYYIELQRHHIDNLDGMGVSQEDVNQILIRWSKKHGVPVIATNDSHYTEEEDANAHDILLCVNTGELQSTPKAKGENYGKKGYRFGFPNDAFYFKTQQEMGHLFKDIPEALDNTNLIVDKVTPPVLERDILLPHYVLPEGVSTQDEYLKILAFEGAKKRYGEISAQIEERINFELEVIKSSGYPGYFLIVQDFTTVARQLGVSVGPGRGSAAGSVVAYCIGITNVDPIKYDLLFERFLNPERVSMPDIDIDFDDEGRQKVIDYVVEKYGQNQVAQIITYGSMAAKSAIRDVGRVLDVPLGEVDIVAKAFPDHLSATLGKVLKKEGVDEKLNTKLNSDQKEQARLFRLMAEKKDKVGEMIRQAKVLEGSVRNTGIHACGVIITPGDITSYLPMTVAKKDKNNPDALDLLVTQYDNSVVEKAGLLKMDFLGLRTLTIIKDAISIIKHRHNKDINPDKIPLDDISTYALFQRGETNGVFQFESAGMQKHLRDLKPDRFEDLIAMNALYRPGPMEYIPNFIARKHGTEPVVYDLDIMEEHLKETYGITVYQEQVMLLSQKMAGFTKGQADSLRKAMGKKIKSMMDELYPRFMDGCSKNGLDKTKVEKVWKDWQAFASYAFNKSHSTCYAFIAYQTGYLKANYPAEYMAAVLTHNMKDISKVNFFLTECRRMKLEVLGPDVNESDIKFTVNKQGAIRFALSALKGVGAAAVEELIQERKKSGDFKSLYNIVKRVNLRSVNKKSLESLALGGAFDCFDAVHRAQYFHTDVSDNMTFIERAVKFGNKHQSTMLQAQQTLFGSEVMSQQIALPPIPVCVEWNLIERLNREKEVTGIYISGHPLDTYRKEMEAFCNCSIGEIKNNIGRELKIAGLIVALNVRVSKKGSRYANFRVEDFSNDFEFWLFGEDFLKYQHLLEKVGTPVFIKGKYQYRYGQEGRLEFKINQMVLLSEIRQTEMHGVEIDMPIESINGEITNMLKDICENHVGRYDLRIRLIDWGEKWVIPMYSSYKIDGSQDFFDQIDTLFNSKYRLN